LATPVPMKLKNAVFPPALIVLGPPPPEGGGIGGKCQTSSAPLLREDGDGVPASSGIQ